MSPSKGELTLPDLRERGGEPAPHRDEPLRLVHHHPGYLRIQADAFVEPADVSPTLAAAETAASTLPGFRKWSHRPNTGSVVIEYDPEVLEADDLLAHVAKRAGFRGLEIATRKAMDRKELVSTFLDSVQGVNHVVGQLTGDRADLREFVPVALVATSVVSFVLNDDRGRLPQWSNALYHAYRVFMHWHRREIRTRERTARQKDVSSEGSGGGEGKDR